MNKKVIGRVAALILAMSLMFNLSSCMLVPVVENADRIRLRNYYSQKDKYISVDGIVGYLAYNKKGNELRLGFSELTQYTETQQTLSTMDIYKFVGDSLGLLQERKVHQKIKIGTKITFVTAPDYFWDAYERPIVALTVDGEELLSFDEGYASLMKWLEPKYDK